MNITEILNQIRVGDVKTSIPDDIRAVLEHELPMAKRAFKQMLNDGVSPYDAHDIATAMALMHVLGVTTDEPNDS